MHFLWRLEFQIFYAGSLLKAHFRKLFVPVFSELSERNTTEAKQFVAASFGLLGVVTLGLSALGVLYADALVTLLAPGFVDDPNKYAATVGALQIMFPYLFCISIVAMSAGVLNTMNRFAVPAVTPVMLNICLILAMWQLMPVMEPSSKALAVGGHDCRSFTASHPITCFKD